MSQQMHDHFHFLELTAQAFRSLGYDVAREAGVSVEGRNYNADLVLSKGKERIVVELKLYTKNSDLYQHFKRAYLHFSDLLELMPGYQGILITNTQNNAKLIDRLSTSYPSKIKIWSIEDLVLKLGNPYYVNEFAYFQPSLKDASFSFTPKENIRANYDSGTKYIDGLIEELKLCPVSKGPPFEKICEKILRLLFKSQLTSWSAQNRTNGGLHKQDLLARILNSTDTSASRDITNTVIEDFWSIVSRHFNCRYITFEFKNYAGKITQGEVLTTEKYLYLKALRSVAILITRNGADTNAVETMRGALREHGKLILQLEASDLVDMLQMLKVGDDPQQKLIEKLDERLLKINR